MNDIIQVDHEALENTAAKFSQQSEAVGQMLQTLQNAMNRLQNDWIGRGSEAFFSEMEKEIVPAVQRLIDALALASETTKEVNQTMQEADEEASTPFKDGASAGGETGALGGAAGAAGAAGSAAAGAMGGAVGAGVAAGVGAGAGGLHPRLFGISHLWK